MITKPAKYEGRTRDITQADLSKPARGDVVIGASEVQLVRRFEIAASAGRGKLIPDEQSADNIAFTREWLLRHGINGDLAGLIKVEGDSMSPTIRNGSLALIHFAEKTIVNGNMYAFTLNDELFIKRLAVLGSEDDIRLLITSDNPNYPPKTIEGSEAQSIFISGRVRAVISEI
ncbi:S24 family peptidase [Litorisediminicola beolgyonensis]|uniref:Helix-turn-helix transcriptional regulator n=1 Tax=Litorisediminicola beolgyonensis TaxID=1173614 RepID=A0ABW3ZIH7_9RHOB